MGFSEIDVRDRYRSSDTPNIGKTFIEKVLKSSVQYKRAVGFFSSSSLIYTSHGLLEVASHYAEGQEPVIKFIVSPRLTKEDIQAIRKGYRTKKEVVESSLMTEFTEPDDEFDKERLNILCHLISSGAMDIKVAVMDEDNTEEPDIGMYHEKIGVMRDAEGNMIAFDGSLNESANAFANNFESITVYKTWTGTKDVARLVESDFDELWENTTNNVAVFDFPSAVKERLFRYMKEFYNPNIERDEEAFRARMENTLPCIDHKKLPTFPYDFQEQAINNWLAHKCVGIFDMATGAGKTFTAYGAMVTLLERCKYQLAIVIVAPYQHLVEQWVEDAPKFNIKHMIVGYSSSKYDGYLTELKGDVLAFNAGTLPYFFFITTNASFKLPRVQEVLKSIKGRALLVADEAHNFGSKNMENCLLQNFRFRLALSATIERHRDEEGTERIFDYFGEKCISYSLDDAMQAGKLTPYEYHPIPVYLEDDEREEYKELTAQISKCMNADGTLSEAGERLALKRARLIAGAHGKIEALRKEIKKHLDEHYMLVYCGTAKSDNGSDEEIRQIDEVTRMLGNELGLKVARYTSRESAEERMVIKNRFKDGDDIQTVVAIKCLDEGVNIPGIRTAFILASSTNPREYVQRRGRVLRTAEGKEKAVIFDFITLPMTPEELASTRDEISTYKGLISNETKRMREFGDHALNISDSDILADQIKEDYGLYDFDDDSLEVDWRLD